MKQQTFTVSIDGVDDNNPLTVKKLKEILSKFGDDDEVFGSSDYRGGPEHSHQNTYIEVFDDWFVGEKKERKLIKIWSH